MDLLACPIDLGMPSRKEIPKGDTALQQIRVGPVDLLPEIDISRFPFGLLLPDPLDLEAFPDVGNHFCPFDSLCPFRRRIGHGHAESRCQWSLFSDLSHPFSAKRKSLGNRSVGESFLDQS